MKIDPHCQRGNCYALKVLFNDVSDYVDIAGRSYVQADVVSCIPYTTAVAHLPLHQLGFLVVRTIPSKSPNNQYPIIPMPMLHRYAMQGGGIV